jgi:hypothetical protein
MDLGPVHRIRELSDRLRADQASLDDAVVMARQSGYSWTVIGMALGVTRQAAHQRFG